jgi:3-oxoacyl-(acyl-carrier-protein) synthase
MSNALQVSRFGALTALGASEAGFEALIAGRDGLGVGPDWMPATMPTMPVTAPLSPGNRTFTLAYRLVEELDLDPEGLAVVFATTTSSMLDGEVAVTTHVLGGVPDEPANFLVNHLPHQPAARVARALGATGPVLTVSTACTSGTVAIGAGADLIRAGRARRALVIGSDSLCRTTIFGFSSLGAYAPGRCRPFDREREGMCIGEGAAYLVLEPATAGARFTLVGVETAADGYHLTAPDPEGAGLARAIRGALGGLNPAEVDHLNAHATGTETNDGAEAAALGRVVPGAAISATKGATGHTLGAAGLVEAVFLLQSMAAEVVPPVVGLREAVAGVDVSSELRHRRQRIGVSVNLAFGGHNAAVAFRREDA